MVLSQEFTAADRRAAALAAATEPWRVRPNRVTRSLTVLERGPEECEGPKFRLSLRRTPAPEDLLFVSPRTPSVRHRRHTCLFRLAVGPCPHHRRLCLLLLLRRWLQFPLRLCLPLWLRRLSRLRLWLRLARMSLPLLGTLTARQPSCVLPLALYLLRLCCLRPRLLRPLQPRRLIFLPLCSWPPATPVAPGATPLARGTTPSLSALPVLARGSGPVVPLVPVVALSDPAVGVDCGARPVAFAKPPPPARTPASSTVGLFVSVSLGSVRGSASVAAPLVVPAVSAGATGSVAPPVDAATPPLLVSTPPGPAATPSAPAATPAVSVTVADQPEEAAPRTGQPLRRVVTWLRPGDMQPAPDLNGPAVVGVLRLRGDWVRQTAEEAGVPRFRCLER